MRCYLITLIDNQLLHSVLKGLVGVLAEMYFDGVSSVPQLPLKTCCPFLVSVILSTLQKIERIDWFLYALTLCYLFSCDCDNDCLDKPKLY